MTTFEITETVFLCVWTLFFMVAWRHFLKRKKNSYRIQIGLDAQDFRDLVKGQIIECAENGNVKIHLTDIGYGKMIEIIEHEKQAQ